ncbi:MAG: hypothetical protein HFACDABA_02777 [Anaerolineales bacterium]|nr:hypothetical protein [Anaerolineales bacterium]
MADILCPHCNRPNPDDQNICSFCRQPLHIVADDKAIHPGDMPTKKITSELEPFLPQWLRDARAHAEEEQVEPPAAETSQPAPAEPAASDWLAGLEAASRNEDEEELPDWMRGIGPSKPTPKPDQPKKAAPGLTRREEISWEEEPSPAPQPAEPPGTGPLGATRSEDGIPYWLKTAEAAAPKETPPDLPAPKEETTSSGNISPFESGTFRPNTGELINWLDKMSPQVGETAPELPRADLPASEPLPDWISSLDNEAAGGKETELNFDWFKDETATPLAAFQTGAETPEQTLPEETSQAAPPAPENSPDWLNAMPATGETAFAANNLPDWLSSPVAETSSAEPAKPSDTPDWMSAFAAQTAPASGEALPDWMKPTTDAPSSKEEAPSLDWMAPVAESSAPKEEALSFDWMSPTAEAATPAGETSASLPSVPAFLPGADELLDTNMPGWLSEIAPSESSSAAPALKTEPAFQDEITPAELPSWVQAMRPVEAALPNMPAINEPRSQPAESQGPLAGLRGVLPLAAGAFVTGKPRAYSIRLEPTSAQQQHAALLEQMLEAETQARPMRGDSLLPGAQRGLRWGMAVILVALIGLLLFSGARFLPLPSLLTPESAYVLDVMNAMPAESPVLLVFDYEPALAGELEAASASFLDYLTAFRNPRYSVLSTSPTGAALAERLLAKSQAIQPERVTWLGYLPGETAGILSFAMNPRAAKPLAQDVNAYADYALVLLLTDRAESARAWVEQTSAQRGGRPLVVIASAQAAPMIQPYLPRQVNALISGLRGGAAFEGATGQAGPAQTYWDAYNLALLTAAALIFLGGMWNLFAGLRARRQEKADA